MPERISTLQKITQSGIWNDGLLVDTYNSLMDKERGLTEKLYKTTATVVAVSALAAACAPANAPQAQETPGTGQNSTEIAPASETDSTFKATFEWTASQAAINEVRSGIENSVSQLTPGFTLSPDAVSGYTIKVDRSALGLSELDVEFVTAREPVLNAMGIPSGDELTRDYMYTGNPGEPAEPLYRQIYDKNGEQWIRQYAYSPLGAEEVVQEYPIDAIERLQKGESVIMHFYPNAEQNAAIGRTDTKPIAVTVSPKPADNVIASAPTPFGNKEVSFVVTATPVPPTETAVSTATAEATRTPEVSFNCPINPDSPNSSVISFERDIKSGNLAEWVLKQPQVFQKMSSDPADLNYNVSTLPSDGTSTLNAQKQSEPGYQARHTTYVGTCQISPAELGFPGKDMGRLLITVLQDKNDRRMVQFTFAAAHHARNLFYSDMFTDVKSNLIVPLDDTTSWDDPLQIEPGAKPGSSADLRPMQDSDIFYAAQGRTRQEVLNLFNEVASTETFSDETVQKFHTTVFYTAIGKNFRD